MPKFLEQTCEVCHKPVITNDMLPEHLRDKVYKPGEDESYNVEIDLNPPEGMGTDERVELDPLEFDVIS